MFVVNQLCCDCSSDDDFSWWAEARDVVEPSVAGEIEGVVRLRPVGVAEQEPVGGGQMPNEFDQLPLLGLLERLRPLPPHVVLCRSASREGMGGVVRPC